MKAAQRLDEVPFAARTNGSLEHGTKNYLEYIIIDNLLSAWDTRGLNFVNADDGDELLMFMAGFGSKGYISRCEKLLICDNNRSNELTSSEKELVRKYRKDFRNDRTTKPLDGIILCIASDANDNEIECITKLLKTLNLVSKTFNFSSYKLRFQCRLPCSDKV